VRRPIRTRTGVNPFRPVLLVSLVVLVVAIGGCGEGERSAARDDGTQTASRDSSDEKSGDGFPAVPVDTFPLVPVDPWDTAPPETAHLQATEIPVEYTSPEAGFGVTWPSGCGRLLTRIPGENASIDDFPGTEPTVMEVRCRRFGQEKEYCWVVSYFNETTRLGMPPDPPHVLDRVRLALDTYKVRVIAQSPIQRGYVAGIDVRAERPGDDPGEFWVWGVLAGPNYYLVGAWKEEGGLFADPEYRQFFDSFRVMAFED
jgi:hypothetical protein